MDDKQAFNYINEWTNDTKNMQQNIKLTNSEWIDFLAEQFDISRTSAKEMLHVMMSVKREDNFKKQFSGRSEPQEGVIRNDTRKWVNLAEELIPIMDEEEVR